MEDDNVIKTVEKLRLEMLGDGAFDLAFDLVVVKGSTAGGAKADFGAFLDEVGAEVGVVDEGEEVERFYPKFTL